MNIILSKDKFPKDLGGGLESDLTWNDPTPGTERKWSVAIANKTRLKKAESEAFRLKLEELTGLKWEVDSVSKFVFHYVPDDKEKKTMAKKKKKFDEQLIEVGPENLKVIAKETRKYRALVDERLILLKNEVKQKEKVKALVKDAELQRLKDGRIQFEVGDETVCLMPQDDLITIKKTRPKNKKGMKGKVEAEEQQHEKS